MLRVLSLLLVVLGIGLLVAGFVPGSGVFYQPIGTLPFGVVFFYVAYFGLMLGAFVHSG